MARRHPPDNLSGKRRRHRNPLRRGGFDRDFVPFETTNAAGQAVAAVVLGFGQEAIDNLIHPFRGDVSQVFTDRGPSNLHDILGKSREEAFPVIVQGMSGILAEDGVDRRTMSVGMNEEFIGTFVLMISSAICREILNSRGEGRIDDVEFLRRAIPIANLFFDAYERAGRLVGEHRDAIKRVEDLLLERNGPTADQIVAIVNRIRPKSD